MSHRGRKRGGGQGVHVIDSDDGADRTVARAQLRKKVRTKAVLSPVQDEHFSDFDPLPQVVLAPTSLQESFAWPFVALAVLCGLSLDSSFGSQPSAVQLACQDRLRSIISVGVCLNGNYSGIDCPSLAAKMMLTAWCSLGLAKMASNVFRTYSSSDILPLCRGIVLSANAEDLPNHVFGDVLDRLPARTRRVVEANRPEAGADPVTTMMGLQEIEDVLSNPKSWPAPGRIISFCYRHNVCCSLFCKIPPAVQDISSDESADEAAVPLADVATDDAYRIAHPEV